MAAMPPAGLAEVCMGQTAGETLEAVVPALVRDVLRFESEGFAAFAARFAQRDALFQQAVRLSDGREGQAEGVDANGALLVNIDGQRAGHHQFGSECEAMLRWVVGLLLVANGVYYAWTQGHLAPLGFAPTEQREPERLQGQIQPEVLAPAQRTAACRSRPQPTCSGS